jgi:hypothetical protein
MSPSPHFPPGKSSIKNKINMEHWRYDNCQNKTEMFGEKFTLVLHFFTKKT